MTNLIITRGVPGCGKTTRAKRWVADCPAYRARLNRDDLRETLHAGYHGDVTEAQVTAVQHAGVLALLRSGVSVIVDDTNRNPATLTALRLLGALAGAEVVVWDMRNVPVDTCVDRDRVRGERGERCVGEDVIRRMHGKFIAERIEGIMRQVADNGGAMGRYTTSGVQDLPKGDRYPLANLCEDWPEHAEEIEKFWAMCDHRVGVAEAAIDAAVTKIEQEGPS
jgi:predicted kinase